MMIGKPAVAGRRRIPLDVFHQIKPRELLALPRDRHGPLVGVHRVPMLHLVIGRDVLDARLAGQCRRHMVRIAQARLVLVFVQLAKPGPEPLVARPHIILREPRRIVIAAHQRPPVAHIGRLPVLRAPKLPRPLAIIPPRRLDRDHRPAAMRHIAPIVVRRNRRRRQFQRHAARRVAENLVAKMRLPFRLLLRVLADRKNTHRRADSHCRHTDAHGRGRGVGRGRGLAVNHHDGR